MESEPIDENLVRRAVVARGFDWHYLAETGSTNADALAHQARCGRDVVAVSEAQSAGRGRRGRQWLSPFARNIYCTIGISKEMPAASHGLLSIVTGIALCRTLRQATGLQVQLKWPNDLLLDGYKLGGILIESRAHAAGRFFFAVGYGLNLAMSDDELASLDRPATSLGRNFAGALDRSALLVATLAAVIEAIRDFDMDSVTQLIADFAGLDAYRDEPVEVISGEQRIGGVNRGIDASGQLRLETARGIELHSAAEISLRADRQ
jgi:BirA family biotin operon repressor/biotin-[acetyl-CoA-carboxylase] ligase